MTDWKQGDRFTIECEVVGIAPSGWVIDADHRRWAPSSLARAVKLPPKARPVRKGDEIVEINDDAACIFLAAEGGRIYYRHKFEAKPHMSGLNDFTHADGAEIDWEASE